MEKTILNSDKIKAFQREEIWDIMQYYNTNDAINEYRENHVNGSVWIEVEGNTVDLIVHIDGDGETIDNIVLEVI